MWILPSDFVQALPPAPAAKLNIHVGAKDAAAQQVVDPVVGSWNIQWFPGRHPTRPDLEEQQKHIAEVAEYLRNEHADILFVCEVRDLKTLRKMALDYSHIACTDIVRLEEENAALPQQSLALLSRLPWEEVWAADFSLLPATADRPSRGFIAARFRLADGTALTVYGVHLKSNRGGAEVNFRRRERAIDYLMQDWRVRGLDPQRDQILLVGDFNTSPHDPVFAQERTLAMLTELGLRNAAEGLGEKERITLPSRGRFPGNDFDHQFLSPALAARMKGAAPWVRIQPVPPSLSDHYPLFLRLDLLPVP